MLHPDNISLPRMTRRLLALHREGALTEVECIDVAPGGVAMRITYRNGACRITGRGDLGIDPCAASDAVQNKSLAKYFLSGMQVVCPTGKTLLLPWWANCMRPEDGWGYHTELDDVAQAVAFAQDELGFPVYVKPVDGNKGKGIARCDTTQELCDSLEQLDASRVKVALIEEAVVWPDYRLVALGAEFIYAYRRTPFTVVGDGRSTVSQLVQDAQERSRHAEINRDDPRMLRCLGRSGMCLGSVPESGRRVQLLDVSNTAPGGTTEDVTHCVALRWRQLVCKITEGFGLGVCGIDLACSNISSDVAEYSVLEVNTCPDQGPFLDLGEHQEALVRALEIRVWNAPPRPLLG